MYTERKIDEYVFQLLKHVTIASGGVLPWIHHELLHRKRGGIQLKPPTAAQDGPSASKAKKPKAKVIPAALPPPSPPKGGKASAKGKALKPPKVKFNAMKIFDAYFFYVS